MATSETLWKDFGAGEHVIVHGLTKAPEYNGQSGVIERWEGDRFVVKLEGKAKGVRIKPENLKPLKSDECQEEEAGQPPQGAHQAPAFSGVVRER